MLITAPIKKEVTDNTIISDIPKYNPNAPINFTSPYPIVSFPDIKFPSNVIARNIEAPIRPPTNLLSAIFMSYIPNINTNIIPISNNVRTSLFGIIFNLLSMLITDNKNGVKIKYCISSKLFINSFLVHNYIIKIHILWMLIS